MFKILDKFGGEVSANEQAIFNKISTNNSSGYVNGYLNSLAIARLTSNTISIDSGLLSIQGFRFVNDTLQTYTVSVTPSQPIPFQLVAVFSHYVSSENDTLSIITRPTESLRQENLYSGSNAVYELELARFTMTADGITDFVVTLEQLTYNDQDFTTVLEQVATAETNSAAALEAATTAKTNSVAAVNTAKTASDTANTAKTASDTATAKVAELSEQIGEKQGTTVTIGGVAQGRVALESATVGNAEKLNGKAASEYALKRIYSTKKSVCLYKWEPKTWDGLTSFFGGSSIWTDGENIYYSEDTKQYVLNRETSTWEPKTWNGVTSLNGGQIWTDGNDIYYSTFKGSGADGSYYHYVLNRETSTWESKTWYGFIQFTGEFIWTDGENIYYSNSPHHYVLNRETSTWESKTWSGLTSFYGYNIWTDGNDIYYSSGTRQYVLNRETSTWEPKIWNGVTSLNGGSIWTDGENIYGSDYSEDLDTINQYKLTKSLPTIRTTLRR